MGLSAGHSSFQSRSCLEFATTHDMVLDLVSHISDGFYLWKLVASFIKAMENSDYFHDPTIAAAASLAATIGSSSSSSSSSQQPQATAAAVSASATVDSDSAAASKKEMPKTNQVAASSSLSSFSSSSVSAAAAPIQKPPPPSASLASSAYRLDLSVGAGNGEGIVALLTRAIEALQSRMNLHLSIHPKSKEQVKRVLWQKYLGVVEPILVTVDATPSSTLSSLAHEKSATAMAYEWCQNKKNESQTKTKWLWK